jgi:hypothetical protein
MELDMTTRIRHIASLTLALLATLLIGATARAQDAVQTPAITTPVALPSLHESLTPPNAATQNTASPAAAGPTLEAASVAVRRPVADEKAFAPAPSPVQGEGTGLMILGGAGVLVGLVVGGGAGYAISVGGAVVGLYGLYQYLK